MNIGSTKWYIKEINNIIEKSAHATITLQLLYDTTNLGNNEREVYV